MNASGHAYATRISLIAATSGLLFGFDIAVINGALLLLRQQFGLSEMQTEQAASSLLIGCVFGAAAGGVLSDRWGRRRILILSALLFALSAAGAALPNTLNEFMLARFIGGLAIGIASLLAPLYIAEVSPAGIRGRLVALNQMAIVSGILLAYLSNWLLSFTGADGWRWMFLTAAIPSIGFFIGLFFVPESPRWLVESGREEEALGVLARVDGESAPAELDSIRETIAEESGKLSELLAPGLRKATIIALALAVLQQITGINTILFYGSIIFREQVGGQSESASIGANVIVGLVNFAATWVALGLIDRLGRVRLLIVSAAVMALGHAAMGITFLSPRPNAAAVLAAMLLCVASFAIGLGPGVWVVMSEIFPTRIRGRAMSVATVALWVACVVLTMTFLTLARWLTPSGAFWLYSGICVGTAIFVRAMVPETRGRTLEEIERFWRPPAASLNGSEVPESTRR
jgi:sugar porter (SP) family MFS transporter